MGGWLLFATSKFPCPHSLKRWAGWEPIQIEMGDDVTPLKWAVRYGYGWFERFSGLGTLPYFSGQFLIWYQSFLTKANGIFIVFNYWIWIFLISSNGEQHCSLLGLFGSPSSWTRLGQFLSMVISSAVCSLRSRSRGFLTGICPRPRKLVPLQPRKGSFGSSSGSGTRCSLASPQIQK